jgi:hypothetical protein
MTTHYTHDPERDETLSALLRDAAGPPPSVDWEALHDRITAAAELPLRQALRDRRRRPRVPLLRALLPLAAAAGLAGAYVALRPADDLTPGDQAMVDQMVEASLPESVDQLITGEAAQGALLEVVEGS